MGRSPDELIGALMNAAQDGTVPEVYEDRLIGDVLSFGEEVVASPTKEKIQAWLQIYSYVSNLALDGAPDLNERLVAANPTEYHVAADLPTGPAKAEIASLRAEYSVSAIDLGQLKLDSANVFASRLEGDLPLASFVASDAITTTTVSRYDGTLTVLDRQRQVIGRYAASTGGFVASYKSRGGPTPPGYYKVSNYRNDRGDTPGMKRDGVSFSFDLTEEIRTQLAPGVYRDAFRIHPDAPPPGTHGCIGIAEDAATLRDCALKLSETLSGGPFRLSVAYGDDYDAVS